MYRSQYVHLNGLLPLCVRLWIVNAPAIANALPHPGKSHEYGSALNPSTTHFLAASMRLNALSCVCRRMCWASVAASEKFWLQILHWNGRCPV